MSSHHAHSARLPRWLACPWTFYRLCFGMMFEPFSYCMAFSQLILASVPFSSEIASFLFFFFSGLLVSFKFWNTKTWTKCSRCGQMKRDFFWLRVSTLTSPHPGGLAASSQCRAIGSNSCGFFPWYMFSASVNFCRQAGESLICFRTVPRPPMVLASFLKQLTCPTQPQCHRGRADRTVITRSEDTPTLLFPIQRKEMWKIALGKIWAVRTHQGCSKNQTG